MKIEIHDVDHGGCAVLTSPSGHRLMLDCGINLERPWFPSVAYRGSRIDNLMFMNLDEDHVEDLPWLWSACPIGAIVSNPTVTAPALDALKAKGGMRNGVKCARNILASFGGGVIGDWFHGLGGISWRAFWNVYGRDFTDTNNLSLAVFVKFGAFTILFGGDMEAAGWRKLLQIPAFRMELTGVNVYVASHHGRDNGRCEELFDYCRPELVIFSDGPKQFGTQESAPWYANRVAGIPDFSKPPMLYGQPLRKVITTRNDGTISLQVEATGRYTVLPERLTDIRMPTPVPNYLLMPPHPLEPAASPLLALAGLASLR